MTVRIGKRQKLHLGLSRHRDQQNQQFRPTTALWDSYGIWKTRKQYLGLAGRGDPRGELLRAASLTLRCRFRSRCRSRWALEVTGCRSNSRLKKSGAPAWMALELRCEVGRCDVRCPQVTVQAAVSDGIQWHRAVVGSPKPVVRDRTVLRDTHEQCPQATVLAGCLVMTQESMVLVLVGQGCGEGWDGALCNSQAVSTGHGAGSGAGVSRSGVIGDAQAAV
ncbi:hypothetical protein NDU88_004981 [Pleurodeles waltl]|uniref:Uncharacterized protein n=1 Tax=Pleurodeles waltl TaxID=8319 RepID=A0AAV7VLX0_PLEWA|nr:hypothetical protein NDU88_004981 [Pleurodeles waltl]